MKENKVTLVLLVIFLNCITNRPSWIDSQQLIVNKNSTQSKLFFFIEPHSDISSLKEIIDEIYLFLDNVKSFPYFHKTPDFKIIIYKDLKSYNKYKNFNIESLAHYDRKNKEIHLSFNNIVEMNKMNSIFSNGNTKEIIKQYNVLILKHEMVHAIIEECCQNIPIWLNEGIALLLQNLNSPFKCEKTYIHLPPSLISYRSFLKKKSIHLPYHPKFDKLYDDILIKNVISGLYVYYLWENKKLLDTYHNYMNDIHFSLYYHLTEGNIEKYENQKKEFYNWLEQININKKTRGC